MDDIGTGKGNGEAATSRTGLVRLASQVSDGLLVILGAQNGFWSLVASYECGWLPWGNV